MTCALLWGGASPDVPGSSSTSSNVLQQPFGWVTTQQLRLQQRSKRLCQGNHSKRCSAELQGWKSNTNGTDLWNMLQQSFGWVTSTGYTSKGGVNTLFPVVVGEFGSSYVDELVRAPPFPCATRPFEALCRATYLCQPCT